MSSRVLVGVWTAERMNRPVLKEAQHTRNLISVSRENSNSHTCVHISEWLQYFTKLLKLIWNRLTYSQSRRCIPFCMSIDTIDSWLYFTWYSVIQLFIFNRLVLLFFRTRYRFNLFRTFVAKGGYHELLGWEAPISLAYKNYKTP